LEERFNRRSFGSLFKADSNEGEQKIYYYLRQAWNVSSLLFITTGLTKKLFFWKEL